MKTAIWILSFLVAALAIVVIMQWNAIKKINASITPADGTACAMADGTAGIYMKGVCIKTQPRPDNASSAEVTLGSMVDAVRQNAKEMSLDLKFS